MLSRGWFTKKIPGGKFLSGFPDIFAWHPIHRLRLIETKLKHRKLNPAQVRFCIEAQKFGLDVYVLIDHNDYMLLFQPANWRIYMP